MIKENAIEITEEGKVLLRFQRKLQLIDVQHQHKTSTLATLS